MAATYIDNDIPNSLILISSFTFQSSIRLKPNLVVTEVDSELKLAVVDGRGFVGEPA